MKKKKGKKSEIKKQLRGHWVCVRNDWITLANFVDFVYFAMDGIQLARQFKSGQFINLHLKVGTPLTESQC